MKTEDVICAVSTPAGVGGIAVVRLSGTGAKELAERRLRTEAGRAVVLKDHRARHCGIYGGGEFVDGTERRGADDGGAKGPYFVDDVVAVYFAGPHSYTGEDVVEISCHGSIYIQQVVLRLFIDDGARLAERGEFTLRAFLNKRLDLSQAEAVADLIDSQSEASHRLAVSQLRGGYAKELGELRQQFIDLAALLELELDFSDEDVEFANRERLSGLVDELRMRVGRLVETYTMGNAMKNGIPVAIVGRPNAGKSSLLNALLSEERAIVSAVPGTTRDTIEETIVIDGMLFRFVDTAGLRESSDELENMGMERTYKAVSEAVVVIFVHDIVRPMEEVKEYLAKIGEHVSMEGRKVIVVHNKCDLGEGIFASGELAISAKEGNGIERVREAVAEAVRGGCGEGAMLTNARHYEAMRRVLAALGEVRKGLDVELTPDLLMIDIRDALYHLGTITGKITTDEMLSSVFSRFCVGK